MTPSTKTKNIIVISCIIASLLILFVILFPFQFSYVQYYQVLFIVGLLLYKAMVLESLNERRNLMSEICSAVHYQAFQMLIRDLGVLLKSFVKCPP